jgi:PKD repeat protein/opacity protein-like surface antigen
MNRTSLKATAFLFLALLFAGQAWAQERIVESIYVTPRLGMSNYMGDLDSDFNFDEWDVDGKIPFYGGIELGYQYSPTFAIGFGIGITDLPTTAGPDLPGDVGRKIWKDELTLKYPAYLVARIQGSGMTSPYFEAGVGGAITTYDTPAGGNPQGDKGKQTFAYGPQVGLGVDFFLNKRVALTIGVQTLFAFADEYIDSDERFRAAFGDADDGGLIRDFAPFDLVSNLSFGFKTALKPGFTPVDVMGTNCPATLQVGQNGAFEAMVNANASGPLEYRWDFGDGSMGTGLMANHSFDRAGTYTTTFTASNGRSMDSESCTVTVVPLPVAAAIVSIDSNDLNSCLAETVRFTSNVRGDTPLEYMWNFGDGTTGTGANPTHVYSQPGTYNVTLTVRNNAGSDTATLTQTVEVCQVANPCAAIAELNSVYFMRNSSVLTDDARAELMENVEVLRDCACIMTRIEGFAAPGERNPQRLSEARANAVMQYYVDNGIPADRLMMEGMGSVGGTTTKKDDTSQFRRVDSIPMTTDCTEMMDM